MTEPRQPLGRRRRRVDGAHLPGLLPVRRHPHNHHRRHHRRHGHEARQLRRVRPRPRRARGPHPHQRAVTPARRPPGRCRPRGPDAQAQDHLARLRATSPGPEPQAGRGAAGSTGADVGEYDYYPTEWAPPYIDRRRKIGWDLYGLLDIGREEDKRRYIKPMLAAEEIWCQGFSEPGSGSDLASLRTRAVLEGENYRVIATSSAEDAFTCLRDTHADLVLSDVVLQGKDGMSLCRELRSRPETMT